MKSLFWNALGVVIVVVFVMSVDWPLWLSIPVGILAMIVVVVFLGFVQAKITNFVKYREW